MGSGGPDIRQSCRYLASLPMVAWCIDAAGCLSAAVQSLPCPLFAFTFLELPCMSPAPIELLVTIPQITVSMLLAWEET